MSDIPPITSIEHDRHVFNYRVAGIAVRPSDGFVLMHRTIRDAFWALPGGRCNIAEVSSVALVREMQEEIGREVSVGPLLILGEVFFSDGVRQYHELGLYYRMTFTDPAVYEEQGDFAGWEPGLPLIYRWVPLPPADAPDSPVAGLPILPIFLRTVLRDVLCPTDKTTYPLHVIHDER